MTNYSAYYSNKNQVSQIAPEDLSPFLILPNNISHEVKNLAKNLFNDLDDPLSKMRKVEDYFKSGYKYQLGIKLPNGEDPMDWFLLEKPAAHCEFFASGTALLLRLGGVPTRYVTGFVVRERNPFGGYWMARKKDAHAWVEAFDPDKGWVIVESTPSEGVPLGDSGFWLSRFWDGFKHFLVKIRTGFSEGFLPGLIVLVVTLFSFQKLEILGILGLAFFCYRFWIKSSSKKKKDSTQPEDKWIKSMNEILKEMDKHIIKRGFHRKPEETLHQFSNRIISENKDDPFFFQIGNWYVSYAENRFRKNLNEGKIIRLKENLNKLIKTLDS